MVPTTPPDPLRAAMARVRGEQPVTPTAPATEATAEEAQDTVRRGRGRLAASLARVDEPGAVVWPWPVAGLVAGLWAAAMSLFTLAVLVVTLWVFAPLGTAGFSDALRLAAAGWLVADGGQVRWAGSVLSLMPLLLTLVILLFQRRAGRWLVAASNLQGVPAAIAPMLCAVASAVTAQVLVANLLASDSLVVPLGRNAVGSAVVAAVGFAWGVNRELVPEWPPRLMLVMRALRAFAFTLAGAASALLLVLAVLRRDRALDVLDAVAGDSTSMVQLLLLCLAYLPTVLLWAVAVLLGPGFGVGLGTHVTVQSIAVSALPPVPLLALLPDQVPAAARWLLVVPVFACGLALWRSRADRALPARAALVAAAGVGAALGALASSGGMGPARLSVVGPDVAAVAVAGVAWMLAAVVLEAAVQALLERRRAARVAAVPADAPDGGQSVAD